MSDVSDLLASTIGKNPVEFNATFDELMKEKIAASLDSYKITLAQSLYSNEEPNDQEDENT